MHLVRPSVVRLTDRLNLADVQNVIRCDDSLGQRRRDDMLSAINTAARVLKRTPIEIMADPVLLSRRLREASPDTDDIRPTRWANVRSLVGTALAQVMPVLPGRQTQKLAPAWQVLEATLMERYGRVRLSSFMHFCTAQDVAPEDVAQSTFDAFEKALANSLRKDPAETYREMVRTWNRAASTIPGWPVFRATCPSRKRTWTLPWSTFPELARNKDAWLKRLERGESDEENSDEE